MFLIGEIFLCFYFVGLLLVSNGFLGYTVARTVDKRNPDAIKGGGVAGKLMKTFMGG